MFLFKTWSTVRLVAVLLSLGIQQSTWKAVETINPECAVVAEHMRAREQCIHTQRQEARNSNNITGCRTEWDDFWCWYRAEVGQVVNVSCPEVSQFFAINNGFIIRNCTKSGWTKVYPSYENACEIVEDVESESEVKTSLHAILGLQSNEHTVHLDRAIIALILNSECFPLQTSCKAAVAFFQFSILANYFWLLVEGMYLQTLLALTFVSQKKYYWWYILIGWGLPTLILTIWVLARNCFDNRGCWDDTDVAYFWWIIKGPITVSLLMNFFIFINVIRILVQKLKSPGMGGSDTNHFMRLAKSTLFLIPLFGMHYMVFAFLPENTGENARHFLELGLGPFQGFVVALLYCFLNGEVQAELKKRLWKWQTQNYLRYSKRRRTLFTESSTVTQISVLEKSSPKLPLTESHNSVSSV
ncbi:vasoactive intestinal polypeptide receptor 1-like [Sinocyclocheilus grahami]|uniref:vasoactive intestinal polypeptide receptor 1-like n=1 Tax=Sinocyclocheilus grahami TaxID=75366 RepID=UPI0007AD13D5|nr:PREDICTED: vasoactive intestinal polypeptide receptor 1-like [Sinocyclocheilus grahami]